MRLAWWLPPSLYDGAEGSANGADASGERIVAPDSRRDVFHRKIFNVRNVEDACSLRSCACVTHSPNGCLGYTRVKKTTGTEGRLEIRLIKTIDSYHGFLR